VVETADANSRHFVRRGFLSCRSSPDVGNAVRRRSGGRRTVSRPGDRRRGGAPRCGRGRRRSWCKRVAGSGRIGEKVNDVLMQNRSVGLQRETRGAQPAAACSAGGISTNSCRTRFTSAASLTKAKSTKAGIRLLIDCEQLRLECQLPPGGPNS